MNDQREQNLAPQEVPAAAESELGNREASLQPSHVAVAEEFPQRTDEPAVAELNGHSPATEDRHARAGRQGARRLHQLIQAGRLYEQEHGLKSGRQRLRQLIELGKLYEQDHGLRPAAPRKHVNRLSRADREELLTTVLECLVRLAKPSFRNELVRLLASLPKEGSDRAA